MPRPSLRSVNARNLRVLRASPLAEISGSLGDLGTLLPLLIALTRTGSISLSSTLVFGGLFNILSGAFFGIPLPVQPMKAIAADSISRQVDVRGTASAGIFVAGAVFLFSATGLLGWFARVIPVPVVKGIQLGAGLSLVLSAGGKLLQPLGWVSPSWADNLVWALFAALLLLTTARSRRFPYALFIFALGLVVILLQRISPTSSVPLPRFRPWRPVLFVPGIRDFLPHGLEAGLGQLPLTTLNSIIAVSHLSADLLPALPAPSCTALGFSVAGMNLLGCWFGAMPVCHGSGGLAGQHRFGARSGASVMLLGGLKLLLGLVLGESLVGLLQAFPKALLGIMVMAAGVELARVGQTLNDGARDLRAADDDEDGEAGEGPKRSREVGPEERGQRWAVMLVTVAGLLAFRNDAVGFGAGMCCHWSLSPPAWLDRLHRRTSGVARREAGEHECLLAGRPSEQEA
ncbi:MAG: hypothetical protein M1832_004767 [Thelocarpon impressellum]|nr:MAG: hypothetical protein M1832_004767 [Thelocarpon impressellum]